MRPDTDFSTDRCFVDGDVQSRTRSLTFPRTHGIEAHGIEAQFRFGN